MPAAALNYAMLLTWSRLVLTPVFIFVFFLAAPWARWLTLAIAIIIELTDMFDGIVARRCNMVTDLGKIIDPFADSVSRLTEFFCIGIGLLLLRPDNLLPLLLVLLIFYRDSLIATLRTVCALRGVVVSARLSGKLKAIIQAIVILIILLMRALQPTVELDQQWYLVYVSLLAVASLATLWSGYDYVQGLRQHIFPRARNP